MEIYKGSDVFLQQENYRDNFSQYTFGTSEPQKHLGVFCSFLYMKNIL